MMIDELKTVSNEEALKTAYAEVCHSYHLIDDFRAKLLGLLPLVSGTGIFLLFSDTGFAQKLAFAQNIENLPRISKKIDRE